LRHWRKQEEKQESLTSVAMAGGSKDISEEGLEGEGELMVVADLLLKGNEFCQIKSVTKTAQSAEKSIIIAQKIRP